MKKGITRLFFPLAGAFVLLALNSCGPTVDKRNKMVVSVRDQKMLLLRDGKPVIGYGFNSNGRYAQ